MFVSQNFSPQAFGNFRGKILVGNRIEKIGKESQAAALLEIAETILLGLPERSISGKSGHQIQR
jgi:hypothetical protein